MTSRCRLLALLVIAVAATTTHAAELCRNPRGALAVREACRKKERGLSVDDLAEPGLPGPTGPQGPDGTAGVFLVDARGSEVGPVVSLSATGSSNQVCFQSVFSHPSLPGPVLLAVTGDGQLGGVISYASDDCTGPAHISLGQRDLWLPMAFGINDAVYVADLQSRTTITERSNEYAYRPIYTCTSITARGGCCVAESSPREVPAYPTRETTRGALGLEVPFALTTR